ncbi:unnamed protein product [Caenorhabditis bovis]|uniref:Sodium/potassium-transporting ATPase subunit beta-1-interacting protein n=1 Tax=Caenorhabditis bovis TaxID=2654633 RepID=A0A8S1ESX9_9PELO|nr:unnamed protein product [Caenorhabditis bovis]
MSCRTTLSTLVLIWLLLALARLLFDLIGKLWLVAIFDLLQIVCCITGLFGSIQKRKALLYALVCSNFISVAQNVLIFLWYIGVFGEITRPLLSAGLPYSFSFFLRFTPACQSHFDLKRTIWVQHNCLVPFYSIEASQALAHIVLAVASTILAILVLVEIRDEKKPRSTTVNHYAQICGAKGVEVGAAPPAAASSSGYVNSTYDELRSQNSSRESRKDVPLPPPPPPQPPIQSQQFERVSKRKRGKIRPNSMMPAPDIPACSSSKSSEDENAVEDVYTKPMKRKSGLQRRSPDDKMTPRAANVTSLVSFDPKSSTLLRVRQHLEIDEESIECDGMYEQLRSRSSGSDGVPPSTIPLSDYKYRNSSQDSVPSMFAPMLNCFSPSDAAEATRTAAPIASPGIRLSDQLALSGSKAPYKSAFRIQSKDSSKVIGHYHAPNEIPLSSSEPVDDGDTKTYPVLTSGGLLV